MSAFRITSDHISKVLRQLDKSYSDAECALIHQNPLQLLVATMLSAQCTDVLVNQVTPELFAAYPDAESLAEASVEGIAQRIRRVNYYKTKAKHIQAAAQMILDDFGGEVPQTLEELIKLPGVARKTANVVLGDGFGKPEGVVVDTHVLRLSRRLGISEGKTPVEVEKELMERLSNRRWVSISHQLIEHGRAVCKARAPLCDDCPLEGVCPRIGV